MMTRYGYPDLESCGAYKKFCMEEPTISFEDFSLLDLLGHELKRSGTLAARWQPPLCN